MKSTHKVKISIGATTILMIFVVLCFTTFSVLSFLTARSDYEMTKRSAAATEEYYKADVRVEEFIASIDEYLLLSLKSANQYLDSYSFENLLVGEISQETKEKIMQVSNDASFTKEQKLSEIYAIFVDTIINRYPNITIQTKQKNEKYLRFITAVNENYQMQLQLLVDTQNASKERYQVISRKLVSTKQWQAEDFELWNE